jgi:hypothetical protein
VKERTAVIEDLEGALNQAAKVKPKDKPSTTALAEAKAKIRDGLAKVKAEPLDVEPAPTPEPTPSPAPAPSRFAGLEGGDFSEFDQSNAQNGTLSIIDGLAFEGQRSAHAAYAGGGANGYQRSVWNVQWVDGDEIWAEAAYFLPTGFLSNIQGQVDLMRWDNWVSHPSDTDWGGVSIYGSDHRARLLRFGDGRPNDTLVGPIDLPEGRWFRLTIHQHLSGNTSALSELYVDGALVGSSVAPNTYGRMIERIRFGIVAIAAGTQIKPLELNFDSARIIWRHLL